MNEQAVSEGALEKRCGIAEGGVVKRRKVPRNAGFDVNAPEVRKWALEIGNLMINYSSMEFVLSSLAHHLSERQLTRAEIDAGSSRSFRQVYADVEHLVRQRSPSDEWLRGVLDKLERAKVIAETRDQVAHSPLLKLDTVRAIPLTPRQRRKARRKGKAGRI